VLSLFIRVLHGKAFTVPRKGVKEQEKKEFKEQKKKCMERSSGKLLLCSRANNASLNDIHTVSIVYIVE